MRRVEEVAKDFDQNTFGIVVFPVTVDRTHQEKNGIADR